MYGSAAYLPDSANQRRFYKPRVHQCVSGTNTTLIGPFYHSYHIVTLLGIQLLEALIVRFAFNTLFVELHGTFLP